ncbi:MAG: hypothetical protein AAGD25_11765 [Cyanobacteria bacterium P01_F01_bin.150]
MTIPEPIRIEAEAMEKSGAYRAKSKKFASGQTFVELHQGQDGQLKTILAGMRGTYAVIVGYADESDGAESMELSIGDEQIRWQLDQHPANNQTRFSEESLVRRVVSDGVELKDGDHLEFWGRGDRGERAAVDYIELIPIVPNIPLPFRVEAEDMDLSLYQAEGEAEASGDRLIRLTQKEQGLAQFAFPKQSGLYDVVVGY